MLKLETIGNRAFYLTPLKHIGDLRPLTTIGDYAFYSTQLEQLGDMEKLTTIGKYAFSGTTIKQLGDMQSLTTIGDYAFTGTPLAQLGDTSALTTIGNFAFANCRDLSVVRLPKTLEEVKKNAFLGLAGEITVEPGDNFVCKCVHLAEKLKKITDVRLENKRNRTYRIKHDE